jgi:hypothetical protein
MTNYKLEYTNIVLMVYKQMVLFIGVLLLFMFGIDSARQHILPSEWRVGNLPTAGNTPPPLRGGGSL